MGQYEHTTTDTKLRRIFKETIFKYAQQRLYRNVRSLNHAKSLQFY